VIWLLDLLLDPYNYIFWIFIFLILIFSITIIWKPFSIYIQFAYINAKVEAIGNPFLTEKDLNLLIESKNINEFKDNLNSNKDFIIEGNNSNEIHVSLDNNYIETLNQTKKDSSSKIKEFFNILYEKHDLYFLKIILKNKLKNENIQIKREIIKHRKINNLIEQIINSDKDKIPEILIKYGFDSKIKEIVQNDNIDYIILDNLIERYILTKFLDLNLPSKCMDAKQDFLLRLIDIKNLKNILRAKNLNYDERNSNNLFLGEGKEISKWKYKELTQLNDVYQIINGIEGTSYYNVLKDSIELYNKDKSTQIFEKLLDLFYLEKLKEISIKNYTNIGPILRFLISKEYEIMNLKIISKGIEEKINSEIISNLLIKVNA
jgi:V/A-type H+-transporting ATPase subunit C